MNSSEKLSPADEEIFDLDTLLDNIENKKTDKNVGHSVYDCNTTEDGIEHISYAQYRDMVSDEDECYLIFEGSRVTLEELYTIFRNQKELYNVDIMHGNFEVPNCEEVDIGLDANSIAMAAMYNFVENGEVLPDTAIAEITKMCDAWNKKHAIKKLSSGKYMINIEEELCKLEEKYKNESYEF